MDTAFAKIVTDLSGKDHILLDGRVIELVGAADQVNPVVDAIVRALRSGGREREMVRMPLGAANEPITDANREGILSASQNVADVNYQAQAARS